MIALLTSLAMAGGGGLFAQIGTGGAWSNDSGPIARGDATYLELGGYVGPYARSMRYGRYTRVGLRLDVASVQPFRTQEAGVAAVGPGLSVARGFDLMNVGVWVGGTFGVLRTFEYQQSDLQEGTVWGAWGVYGRGEVGGMYNVGSSFGVGLRAQIGLNRADRGTVVSGGLGLNLLFRFPLVTPRRQLRREERESEEEAAAEEAVVEEAAAEEA